MIAIRSTTAFRHVASQVARAVGRARSSSVGGRGGPVSFVVALFVAAIGGAASALFGDCGPFTDVTAFCGPILELYDVGVANGSSATTFDPNRSATRGEVAAFVARSFDQSLRRLSRRAALGQWWTTTPQWSNGLAVTSIGSSAFAVVSDGADLWVTSITDGTVSRVRASDGRVLGTWTGMVHAYNILVAMGRVFVTTTTNPGNLYMIDPSQPPGVPTAVVTNLPYQPVSVAFDGSRLWTANFYSASVSIITPAVQAPWSSSTISGPFNGPLSAVYDGTNMWITDVVSDTMGALLKLDSDGHVLQSVPVGKTPYFSAFDGTHIWVPNARDSTISVVRASTGAVDATLSGNHLDYPFRVAFDGSRILVTNNYYVSLWNASDLSPIGAFNTAPESPVGACSDGLNFWVSLFSGKLARY